MVGCGLFGGLGIVASCGLFTFCLERLDPEQGPMALCPDLALGLMLCMFETLVWNRCFPHDGRGSRAGRISMTTAHRSVLVGRARCSPSAAASHL